MHVSIRIFGKVAKFNRQICTISFRVGTRRLCKFHLADLANAPNKIRALGIENFLQQFIYSSSLEFYRGTTLKTNSGELMGPKYQLKSDLHLPLARKQIIPYISHVSGITFKLRYLGIFCLNKVARVPSSNNTVILQCTSSK